MHNHIKLMLTVLVCLITTALPCLSALPTELHGSWVLDEPATIAALKKSPKWDAQAEKMIPMMIKFMKNMSMSFTEDTMTQAMGEKKVVLNPTLISSKEGTHIFSATHKETPVTFTVTITKDGKLNLRADNSDDMDYIVWKKGAPVSDADAGKAQAEAMVNIMKTAMTATLDNSEPQRATTAAESKPSAAYTLKWGRLNIQSLTDADITAINAADDKEKKQVNIEERCTQEDFSKIAQLSGITNLTIRNNSLIKSLDPLSELNNLKYLRLDSLDASKEYPVDLTPLASLSQLETLDCYATRVTNTKALANMETLKDISFYMSAVNSLEFLKSTPNVENLSLYGYKHTFKDYEPLLSLSKLRKLNIYMNKTATDDLLAPLSTLTSIEEISMSNSKEVTTLDFLSNSTNLTTVKAAWCKTLTDISALADKAELEIVNIEDSSVTDFSALSGKLKLLNLDVADTEFSDLSIISESKELQSLEIHGSKINDISPLSAFKKLRSLSVSETTPDSQIEALKIALPDLRVRKSK